LISRNAAKRSLSLASMAFLMWSFIFSVSDIILAFGCRHLAYRVLEVRECIEIGGWLAADYIFGF
jgi:hypothetical protein